jgi:RNA polymerase sigma factor (sigma-70 family)
MKRRIEESTMSAVGAAQLSRLLDEQASVLVLYARQWCDTPEDVVQEAIVKFAAQEPPPKNAVAWLYRVVRNQAIAAGRAAARRSRHESEASRQRMSWFTATTCSALDAEAATQQLKRLPIEQREAIVARLWGGLGFEEIAQLAGCSKSTAHRNYQAGLKTLRERLGLTCPQDQ